MGSLANNYAWESLGPEDYFQLMGTVSWSLGAIVDQFIAKRVHQRPCRKHFSNILSYSDVPQREIVFSRFQKKCYIYFQTKHCFSYLRY